MAWLIPQGSDSLGGKNHSKMHRVVQIDSGAADASIKVNPDGTTTVTGLLINTTTLSDYIGALITAALNNLSGYLPLTGGSLSGNVTFSDAGKGIVFQDGSLTSTGIKSLTLPIVGAANSIGTGDGKFVYPVPEELNGYKLIGVILDLTAASSSGLPTYQIRRTRSGTDDDMLTTKVSCDVSELSSRTAATSPVINATYEGVQTGDKISCDKDVAGTGELGDTITLRFKKQ
jgi:hypothetical protein